MLDDHAELVVRVRSLPSSRPAGARRKASLLQRVLERVPLGHDPVFNARRFARTDARRSLVLDARLATARAGLPLPAADAGASDGGGVLIFRPRPPDCGPQR